MSGINQLALSLIRRNAPYRGPRTSDSWNDTIDEISNDLASVISEWNLKLYPLLLGVPDGTDDVNIDAFTNGLDGSQLYVDHDSTESDENGAYWNETYSRPITLKESLTEIREEIESNYNDLAALVAEASGALTHDQKRAIGLEIFSDDYTFTGISILTRSQNNEYNIVQLAKDIYGSSFSLDSDGIANFSNSINSALESILTLHQGTWSSDVTLIHDIVNADVNDNAAIVQTKLDNSGAGAIDTFDIGVDPVETLLDDLNVARTVIRILKGTAGWADEILEPYAGGPVDLAGHIWDNGSGSRAATNPHGLTFDDVEGTDINYIRSVLGITSAHQQPPYAAYPGGDSLNYLLSTDPVTGALVKLDDAIDIVGSAGTAHELDFGNPHAVTAAQITHAAIAAEINANSSLIDWDNIDTASGSIADIGTKNHALLDDTGVKSHTVLDSEVGTLLTDVSTLRGDVDTLIGSDFLIAADITYSFLDSDRGLVGTTASTLAAGDDSRFGAPVAPLNHGNESHTSSFIDATHIQGSGSAPPSSGEHYAADVYVEDSAGNFSTSDVEQVLAEIFGGSVKTSSADEIYAKHTFSSGEDFTMTAIVNPNHQDLVVDDLKHTDIVAASIDDIQHEEVVVDNVNIVDMDLSNVTDFDVGETVTQTTPSSATGEIVDVDSGSNSIVVKVLTGTFNISSTITCPAAGSATIDDLTSEYPAYAIDDTVDGITSGASGTVIYIDDATDTLWINAITGGPFQSAEVIDNGGFGLGISSGVTSSVDTYAPLDDITTDTGATAEVIETDTSNTLIRVRNLVGTVSATDIVYSPNSPIELTVQSSTLREFSVGDAITGDTAGVGTIEKIDEPNKTLRVLASPSFIVSERVTYSTYTQTEVDSLPSVTSSFHIGDTVTGSISTETGTVTGVDGAVLSVGNASGAFNASDVFTTDTPNDLGDSGFSGSVDQAPFDVTSSELVANFNADLLDGQEGTYYLDRTNHSGTQAVSTLSDHNVGAHTGLGLAALADNNTWTKAQAVSTVTLTDATTIVVDASLSNVFTVTLGGNRTLENPTNLISGGTYIFHINQDGTPPRTLTYDTLYKFPGGTTPTLSTTANAKDTLTCIYDGTVLRCAMQLDFK